MINKILKSLFIVSFSIIFIFFIIKYKKEKDIEYKIEQKLINDGKVDLSDIFNKNGTFCIIPPYSKINQKQPNLSEKDINFINKKITINYDSGWYLVFHDGDKNLVYRIRGRTRPEFKQSQCGNDLNIFINSSLTNKDTYIYFH